MASWPGRRAARSLFVIRGGRLIEEVGRRGHQWLSIAGDVTPPGPKSGDLDQERAASVQACPERPFPGFR